MDQNGLSHALILDKKGGAKEISYEQISSFEKSQGILWVHFDYTNPQAIQWITDKSNIDPIAVELLLAEDTRPRTIVLEDNVLLALRAVDLNPDSNPEEMISLRLFISENLIITTKKRDLLSIKDLLTLFKQKKGPVNSSEFLITITDRLTFRMDGTIDKIEDRVSEVEELLLESDDNMELRSKIAAIRREAITIRRYLSPQKEAISLLYHEKVSWLDDYNRIELREVNNQLVNYIEDLDSINEKITLIKDELTNIRSDQMNQRMYVLSIISVIFLPLSFLTGLFGINVGGIPGAQDSSSFEIFSVLLIGIGFLQFLILKKYKWI
ncbi:zinc transporter ZntB [Halarcobacter anaerophilus]|jgi:zinc transporter|uniref:Zinc transporter ZntB n=1 Tax=Halarcobacter anaerophilus TaxID=877500 RepID=A0A4Q0XVN4_9BACT|nr:zinc transporter ZntB [Halarcobacter anaerophilus]QDF28447.1 zinc transporter (EcCorA_ZntB-like family) [Halarcobacter anaerophilus]RXJ61640.1 zinc transporter ZntB [Halarcobacter anaerophilus]